MKSFTITTLAAGAIFTAALGFAVEAHAAPSGPATAQQTVEQLQANGFQVILNKIGTQPLSQCTVRGIHPQTLTRMDSGSGTPGAQDDIVTTVTSMVAYVDVMC